MKAADYMHALWALSLVSEPPPIGRGPEHISVEEAKGLLHGVGEVDDGDMDERSQDNSG